MPRYGHNRTTGHSAAPLERLGIERFRQGQPLSTERMKGSCFTIDFSYILLSFLFGAVMDEQQRLCIRNAMFIFLNTTRFSTAPYSKLPSVLEARHPAEYKITMPSLSENHVWSGNCTSDCWECFKQLQLQTASSNLFKL